jgi:hypothetical protein
VTQGSRQPRAIAPRSTHRRAGKNEKALTLVHAGPRQRRDWCRRSHLGNLRGGHDRVGSAVEHKLRRTTTTQTLSFASMRGSPSNKSTDVAASKPRNTTLPSVQQRANAPSPAHTIAGRQTGPTYSDAKDTVFYMVWRNQTRVAVVVSLRNKRQPYVGCR